MFEKFPGDQRQYFYTGSIGKVLAGFFCKGIETHVGEPFSGLNANLMVSEINRLLELNADYCEKVWRGHSAAGKLNAKGLERGIFSPDTAYSRHII